MGIVSKIKNAGIVGLISALCFSQGGCALNIEPAKTHLDKHQKEILRKRIAFHLRRKNSSVKTHIVRDLDWDGISDLGFVNTYAQWVNTYLCPRKDGKGVLLSSEHYRFIHYGGPLKGWTKERLEGVPENIMENLNQRGPLDK